MKLDRSKVTIVKQTKQNDYFVDASLADRVACVWDLTSEIWSISNKEYVESRLQRHVTKLIRQ